MSLFQSITLIFFIIRVVQYFFKVLTVLFQFIVIFSEYFDPLALQ